MDGMYTDELNDLKANLLKNLNFSQKFLFLFDLIKTLPYNYLKFLNTVLSDHLINPRKSPNNIGDFKIFEEQANDILYIELLEKKSNEDLVKLLLKYLPLINCNKISNESINSYKALIERLVQSKNINFHSDFEYQQLLSIIEIHPLFSTLLVQPVDQFVSTSTPIKQQLHKTQSLFNKCKNNIDEAYESMQSLTTSTLSNLNVTQQNEKNKLFLVSKLSEANYDTLNNLDENFIKNFEQFDSKGSNERINIPSTSQNPVEQNSSNLSSDSSGHNSCDMGINDQLLSSNRLSLPTTHTPLAYRSSAPANTASLNNSFNPPLNHMLYGGSTSSIYKTKEEIASHSMFSPSIVINSESSDAINTFTITGSGMRDVPLWLKSLRLHKYTSVFSKLTYDEMMNLDESKLYEQNVTSGATNKILKHIQKLKERNKRLVQILQTSDFTDIDVLDSVLSELTEMSFTPMKPLENEVDKSKNENKAEDDQLTKSFIKILEKIHEEVLQIYSNPKKDKLYLNYIQLIDKLFKNGSFNESQKEQMKAWRSKLCQSNKNLKFNFNYSMKPKQQKRPSKDSSLTLYKSVEDERCDSQITDYGLGFNKYGSNAWVSQCDVNANQRIPMNNDLQMQSIQRRLLGKTSSYPNHKSTNYTSL